MMARPRPRLLLFDFDGVLVDYRREVRCQHLARAIGSDAATIQRALFKSGLENRSDRGELELDDYLDALRSQYGLLVPDEAFIAARCAATQPRRDMQALCQQLRDQAALAIFTNNGRWLVQNFNRIAAPFAPLFASRILCSAELGLCKPDPHAYLACLQELGFQPGSTLFIDDHPDNVAQARTAGLQALQFESVPLLRDALNEFGFELDPAHAP